MSAQWLDILKASGWKTAAIAAAAALLLVLNSKKILPVTLDPWVLETAEVAVILCGSLTVFSLLSGIVTASKPFRSRFAQHWAIRRAQHDVKDAIPQLTVREREILGYIIQKNQRHFSYTQDGGYASTLIAKRFVTFAGVPGQVFAAYNFPFEVPKHVWEVLNRHKENLVCSHQEGQPFPWAVHWSAR